MNFTNNVSRTRDGLDNPPVWATGPSVHPSVVARQHQQVVARMSTILRIGDGNINFVGKRETGTRPLVIGVPLERANHPKFSDTEMLHSDTSRIGPSSYSVKRSGLCLWMREGIQVVKRSSSSAAT